MKAFFRKHSKSISTPKGLRRVLLERTKSDSEINCYSPSSDQFPILHQITTSTSEDSHMQKIQEKNEPTIAIHRTASGSTTRTQSQAAYLPAEVLETIFAFLCPHSQDETYLSNEESAADDTCMLCDMRNLANASRVCREWKRVAQTLLYRSIRIDTVHYCHLEGVLSERRRRRSRWGGCEDPLAIPSERLVFLRRTLQENRDVAEMVELIKMPYMTRESWKQELGKLVFLTPNLRYIDLPEGVYQDDPSCANLKSILLGRCLDLRKMKWMHGAERTFAASDRSYFPWKHLEEVELVELKVGSEQIASVLSSLPNLQSLTLKKLAWVADDTSFAITFPKLHTLVLEEVTGITTSDIISYLSANPDLHTLTLTKTPIDFSSLPDLLAASPTLHTLNLTVYVSDTLPRSTPPLSSPTLHTLKFSIHNSDSTEGLSNPSKSHYTALAAALAKGSFPSLRTLHVSDAEFLKRLPQSALPEGYPPLTVTVESVEDLRVQRFCWDGDESSFCLMAPTRDKKREESKEGLLVPGMGRKERLENGLGEGWWGS